MTEDDVLFVGRFANAYLKCVTKLRSRLDYSERNIRV
jgi:hypothetical protein